MSGSSAGKRFFEARDARPQIATERSFSWWRLKASLNARAKSRVFGKPREISVSTRVRGGPGRTRTSNQTVMSGTPSPETPEKSDD